MTPLAIVQGWQARLRAGVAVDAVVAAMVTVAGVTAGWSLVGRPVSAALATGIPVVVGLALAAGLTWRGWRRWTPLAAASLVEARVPGLDNLVVSAVQLAGAPVADGSRLRDELDRLAVERAGAVDVRRVVPLGTKVWRAAVIGAASGAAWWALSSAGTGDSAVRQPVEPPTAAVTSAISRIRARVSAPDYRRLAPVVVEDADVITVPEGGRVRLEVESGLAHVWLQRPDGVSRLEAGGGVFVTEWAPETTSSVVVAAGADESAAEGTRLVLVQVVADEAPRVRVTAPGRDIAFPTPAAVVPVTVEAEDAEALAALELRYVKLSGAGESFTFNEGRLPLEVSREAPTRWVARTRWPLSSLGLDDGDAVVYRAVVRDTKPGRDWVSSESYTIDIGRRLEFAGAGFAVPDEDRRYAISQQMVIIKTEQLDGERGRTSADDWATRTKLLAIEQRMVRSEVIFLSGGEVQDEVEEAAHSHELQEGRLENAGRVEMLRAINDMSRAEALLNGGDTAGALVFERSALAALQRAFDRRRYFLRTTPERSRIDPSRRLSGDLDKARPFERPRAEGAAVDLAAERALASALASVATGTPTAPDLVSRVAAMAAGGAAWHDAARALAAAATEAERRAAVDSAMRLLVERARLRLQPTGGWPSGGENLDGWLADELRAGRPQ